MDIPASSSWVGYLAEPMPDGARRHQAVHGLSWRITADIAWIPRQLIEGRPEQQDPAGIATDQLALQRTYGECGPSGLAAPDNTAQNCAIESIRHTSPSPGCRASYHRRRSPAGTTGRPRHAVQVIRAARLRGLASGRYGPQALSWSMRVTRWGKRSFNQDHEENFRICRFASAHSLAKSGRKKALKRASAPNFRIGWSNIVESPSCISRMTSPRPSP